MLRAVAQRASPPVGAPGAQEQQHDQAQEQASHSVTAHTEYGAHGSQEVPAAVQHVEAQLPQCFSLQDMHEQGPASDSSPPNELHDMQHDSGKHGFHTSMSRLAYDHCTRLIHRGP